jgi:hypothetical protein
MDGKIRNSNKIVESILGRDMANWFSITARVAETSGAPTFSLHYRALRGGEIKLVWDCPLGDIKRMLMAFKEANTLMVFPVVQSLVEEFSKPVRFKFKPQQVKHTFDDLGNTRLVSEAKYQSMMVWAWYCAEDETWFVEPKGLGHNWSDGHYRMVEREEIELLP